MDALTAVKAAEKCQSMEWNAVFKLNCREGSLETCEPVRVSTLSLNCREGSLETSNAYLMIHKPLNCREGSLEITVSQIENTMLFNCREGSLKRGSLQFIFHRY